MAGGRRAKQMKKSEPPKENAKEDVLEKKIEVVEEANVGEKNTMNIEQEDKKEFEVPPAKIAEEMKPPEKELKPLFKLKPPKKRMKDDAKSKKRKSVLEPFRD